MDQFFKSHYLNKLEQIFLYITNKCNYRCTNCLIGDRKNYFFSLDEIKLILNTIKCNGCKKVTLIGGEPTEHSQLTEIIDFAKYMNYEVVLDTNGSFTSSFFENEKFIKINMLCFSVDGYNATLHDSFRRIGSFNQIMNHVKLAKANNLKVKFTHTINKTNLAFVLDMIKLSIDMEIDELNFHVATYNGRAKYAEYSSIVSPEEWYNAYFKIRNFISGKIINKPILRIPPRYCNPAELVKFYPDHKCVSYLRDRMLILPKDTDKGDIGGPLYACGLLIGEEATIGWNVNGKFIFNNSKEGEYFKYYSKQLPFVDGIPICPIISQDIKNMNFLNNKNLVPLCISYKPQIL